MPEVDSGDSQQVIETMCAALRAGRRVKIVDRRGRIYGTENFRLLEVHAVGYAHGGFPVARVWEVAGFAFGKGEPRWEFLRLSNVVECNVTEERSKAPRSGFQRDDAALKEVFCQV